jgi:hypothetical protein
MNQAAGMRGPVLRAYVIGQTPRPDLTDDLQRRLPGTAIEVVGALDGLSIDQVETCRECDYPLETRLRDGSRVVVDAAWVEARLQDALDAWDGEALAHLVLCAGPFPSLALQPRADVRPAPLLRPFDTAARVLRERGYRTLAVLVPFREQALPAQRKWVAAGFDSCAVRALTERPDGTAPAEWIASWAGEAHADVVVFDYVGFPSGTLDAVAAGTGLPVIDLGHLTLDLLADTLHAP